MKPQRLSNGITVNVRAVPPFVLTDARRILAGLPDDERERALRGVAWLHAFPDVVVPDDWEFPRSLRFAGIEPRTGEEGRLLDYIEYGLLVTRADIEAVQAVMYSVDLTEDEIRAAEPMFPVDRRGAGTAQTAATG